MRKEAGIGEAVGQLRRVPPFACLSLRTMSWLARDLQWHEIAPGAVFVREAEVADRLWVVTDGCCSLVHRRGGEQRVAWFVEAPVVVGEQAVLPPPVAYPVSITAHGQCRAMALGGERVRRVIASEPQFAAALLELALRRDADLLSQLDVVTTPGAEERVAKYLTRRAEPVGDHEWQVSIPVSRKHLARLLALTPETLSRVLKRFRHRGWVENAEYGLRIIDRGAVRAAQDTLLGRARAGEATDVARLPSAT